MVDSPDIKDEAFEFNPTEDNCSTKMTLSDDLNLLQAVLNMETLTDEDKNFKIHEAKDWFEAEKDQDLTLPAKSLLEDNEFFNSESKDWFDKSETKTVCSERSLFDDNDYMNIEAGSTNTSVSELGDSTLTDFTPRSLPYS